MWDVSGALLQCRGRDSAISVMQDALAKLRKLGYGEEKIRKAEDNVRLIVDGLFPRSEAIRKSDRDAYKIAGTYLIPSRLAAGIQTLRNGTFDADVRELTIEEYRAMPKPDKKEQLFYLLVASKLPKGETIRGKICNLKAMPQSVFFSPKECRVLARAIYGRDDVYSRLRFNKLFVSASTPKTVMFYYRNKYRFVSGNIISMSKVTDIHVGKDGTQCATDKGVTFYPSNLFYYYVEKYAEVNLKELTEGIRGKNGGMVCTICMAAIAQWASILMRVRKVDEYTFTIAHDMIFEDVPKGASARNQKIYQLRKSVSEAAETAARILKAKSWRRLDDGSVELVFDKSIDTGINVLVEAAEG